MDNNKIRRKKMEKLKLLITTALLNNKALMTLFTEMEEGGMIDSDMIMGFAFNVSDLIETNKELSGDSATKPENGEPIFVKTNNEGSKPGSVDGQDLSPNEGEFLKFCEEGFDQEEWLKKHRLTL